MARVEEMETAKVELWAVKRGVFLGLVMGGGVEGLKGVAKVDVGVDVEMAGVGEV